MVHAEDSPISTFFDRVTNLPVVALGWNYACDFYGKTKDYNLLLKKTLDTAEETAKFAAGKAKPIVSRLEKPLAVVDSLACKGLDQVEDKLPAIKKSPEEIVDTVKTLTIQKMDTVKSTASSVGNYGYSSAAMLLNNKYGLLVLDSVNWTLSTANGYMEQVMPTAEEDCKEETLEDENVEQNPVDLKLKRSLQTVVCISNRLKKTVNHLSLSRLETVERPHYLVSIANLLQNASGAMHAAVAAIVSKAKNICKELEKETSEEGKGSELERCAIMAAYNLVCRTKFLYNSTVKAIQEASSSVYRMRTSNVKTVKEE